MGRQESTQLLTPVKRVLRNFEEILRAWSTRTHKEDPPEYLRNLATWTESLGGNRQERSNALLPFRDWVNRQVDSGEFWPHTEEYGAGAALLELTLLKDWLFLSRLSAAEESLLFGRVGEILSNFGESDSADDFFHRAIQRGTHLTSLARWVARLGIRASETQFEHRNLDLAQAETEDAWSRLDGHLEARRKLGSQGVELRSGDYLEERFALIGMWLEARFLLGEITPVVHNDWARALAYVQDKLGSRSYLGSIAEPCYLRFLALYGGRYEARERLQAQKNLDLDLSRSEALRRRIAIAFVALASRDFRKARSQVKSAILEAKALGREGLLAEARAVLIRVLLAQEQLDEADAELKLLEAYGSVSQGRHKFPYRSLEVRFLRANLVLLRAEKGESGERANQLLKMNLLFYKIEELLENTGCKFRRGELEHLQAWCSQLRAG